MFVRGSSGDLGRSWYAKHVPGRVDRERFDAFYTRYAPVAHRRVAALLRRDADAWDVVQEVFRRVLGANLDFPSELAELSWVYRASTNLALKVLRSRKVREPLAGEAAADEPSLEPRHLEARNFTRVLAADLNERELEVAVLHLHDGMTQDEIAAVLEVSRKTIVRDLQTIRALAERLAQEEGGGGHG